MMEREESRKLKGIVQIDDAYLGGELNGVKSGRGSENKQFVIAVQADENLGHPTLAVIEPVRTFDDDSMKNWIDRLEEAGHAHTTFASSGINHAVRRGSTHAVTLPKWPRQPPLWAARDAAEAGQRTCALQACSGAGSAIGQQLSWLRDRANQVG